MCPKKVYLMDVSRPADLEDDTHRLELTLAI